MPACVPFYRSGFSLMEMVIALTILSIIASVGVNLYREKDYTRKNEETRVRLLAIEEALQRYREANHRLPCPADGSLPDSDANYGKEGKFPGNCRDGEVGMPLANEQGSTDAVLGVLPVRALQLPDDFMLDAWGRRITYAVDRRMTHLQASFKYPVNDCDVGSLSVRDASGSLRTNRAVYVLLSHGENGHGAFLASGARRNARSVNSAEQLNARYSESGGILVFSGTFTLQREAKNAANIFNQFDDLLIYKERWNLAENADIATKPIQKFVKLQTGGYAPEGFTCGLTDKGRIYCWGGNSLSQLGDGTSVQRVIPALVAMPAGVLKFVDLSVASAHACAVASNGNIYCWGSNDNGQFGNGGTASSNIPTPVALPSGISGFSSVATEGSESGNGGRTCAFTNKEALYCWGDQRWGGIGDNTAGGAFQTMPVAISLPSGVATFQDLAVTQAMSCAAAGEGANIGEYYCWGRNATGVVGTGSATAVNKPMIVYKPFGVSRIIGAHALNKAIQCALGDSGIPYCWGNNSKGTVGNGTMGANVLSPAAATLPSGVSSFSKLTIPADMQYFVCALGNDTKPYCWGENTDGRLGDGTSVNRSVPTAVLLPAGVSGFYSLYAFSSSVCGMGNDNKFYCWGDNGYGQLGDGSTIDRNRPVPATMPVGVTRFTVLSGKGGLKAHICGIGDDGNAYCWGNNDYGQLGDGTTISRSVPTLVQWPPACYK